MASPKPRSPAPADLRRRVLDASIALIEERGLAELSMREVARVAGVSHQAPYHHFTDREAILAAIAADGFTLLADRLRDARAGADDALDEVGRAGAAYVRFACDHPAHFRVMFRADFVDMARFPEAEACGDRAFATLPEIVALLGEAGMPLEPSAMAHVVLHWSVCHGLACLMLDGPLKAKLPELATGRDALTRDVMAAVRSLVAAKMAAGAPRASAGRKKVVKRARKAGAPRG